jgi:hypothetical protein
MTIEPRRLDSWREIAEYLGRDVRTVIRWEQERGMSVHRVPGTKRSNVFAFTEEIDAWLTSAAQGDHPKAAGDAPAGPTLLPAEREAAPRGRIFSSRKTWVAVVAGLTSLVLGVFLRAHVSRKRPAGAVSIDTISITGAELVALGPGREVLWRHDFGRAVRSRMESQIDKVPAIFSAADDLDGDGHLDLVVSVPFRHGPTINSPDWDELFAFSAEGRVLWSHRLERALAFGAGTFAPPWRSAGALGLGAQIVVFEVDGQKRIAWAQCHHTWWPSILTLLDATGHPLSRWVHGGVIYAIVPATSAAGPRLLVGGVSNARQAAFVALLDARHVEGAGPEEAGSPFECLSCGPGRPLRYLTIQPSELMLASGPYNHVFDIRPDESGVEIRTFEASRRPSMSRPSPGSPPASPWSTLAGALPGRGVTASSSGPASSTTLWRAARSGTARPACASGPRTAAGTT